MCGPQWCRVDPCHVLYVSRVVDDKTPIQQHYTVYLLTVFAADSIQLYLNSLMTQDICGFIEADKNRYIEHIYKH